MKGFLIGLGTLLLFPIIAGLAYWSIYNGLVSSDEGVRQSYAQVQNVMQRQSDLIPNLVEAVKGYAAHESKTLTQVTEARSKLSSIARMDPEKLAANPDLQKQLVEAQASAQQAMVNLNALKEAYPQLQANQNFQTLMAELAGSQNRISVERRKSQFAVEAYNVKTRSLISGMVARSNGFEPKPYFEASATAQNTPQVRF